MNAREEPSGAPSPAGRATAGYPRGTRLLVGVVVGFVVASLLYGPQQVIQMLVFATVCTVGIGLLLILVACWMVGWVVLEVWTAVSHRNRATLPS